MLNRKAATVQRWPWLIVSLKFALVVICLSSFSLSMVQAGTKRALLTETTVTVTVTFSTLPTTSEQRSMFAAAFRNAWAGAVALATCVQTAIAPSNQTISYEGSSATLVFRQPLDDEHAHGIAAVVSDPLQWVSQLDVDRRYFQVLRTFLDVSRGSRSISATTHPAIVTVNTNGCHLQPAAAPPVREEQVTPPSPPPLASPAPPERRPARPPRPLTPLFPLPTVASSPPPPWQASMPPASPHHSRPGHFNCSAHPVGSSVETVHLSDGRLYVSSSNGCDYFDGILNGSDELLMSRVAVTIDFTGVNGSLQFVSVDIGSCFINYMPMSNNSVSVYVSCNDTFGYSAELRNGKVNNARTFNSSSTPISNETTTLHRRRLHTRPLARHLIDPHQVASWVCDNKQELCTTALTTAQLAICRAVSPQQVLGCFMLAAGPQDLLCLALLGTLTICKNKGVVAAYGSTVANLACKTVLHHLPWCQPAPPLPPPSPPMSPASPPSPLFSVEGVCKCWKGCMASAGEYTSLSIEYLYFKDTIFEGTIRTCDQEAFDRLYCVRHGGMSIDVEKVCGYASIGDYSSHDATYNSHPNIDMSACNRLLDLRRDYFDLSTKFVARYENDFPEANAPCYSFLFDGGLQQWCDPGASVSEPMPCSINEILAYKRYTRALLKTCQQAVASCLSLVDSLPEEWQDYQPWCDGTEGEGFWAWKKGSCAAAMAKAEAADVACVRACSGM